MTPPSTPPAGGPRKPTRPRIQSPTERELVSEQARRERASSITDAVPEPTDGFEEDNLTDRYEGEELERMRREKRSTDQRLSHVENKLDRWVAAIGDFKQEVTGKVEHMSGLVEGMTGEVRRVLERIDKRDHVTFTAKVDVEAAKEKAEIEAQAETEVAKAVAEAKKEAAIEIAKAKAELEAKGAAARAELVRLENRRKMIQKIAAGAGLLVLGIIIHAIAQRLGIKIPLGGD